MAAELDPYEALLVAFERHYEYPGNIIAEQLPRNVRVAYQNYLEKRSHLLFESTGRHRIWFWEAWVGENGKTPSISASPTSRCRMQQSETEDLTRVLRVGEGILRGRGSPPLPKPSRS